MELSVRLTIGKQVSARTAQWLKSTKYGTEKNEGGKDPSSQGDNIMMIKTD